MRLIDVVGIDEEIRCEMCENPMHTDRGCDGGCIYDEKLYKRIMQILDERIKPLPSAQPELRWIPCSERLPEEPYGCLVTVWDTDPITMDEFENILPYFVGWDGEQWNDADGEQCPFEVIAWMPLPEPYRGERTEE